MLLGLRVGWEFGGNFDEGAAKMLAGNLKTKSRYEPVRRAANARFGTLWFPVELA